MSRLASLFASADASTPASVWNSPASSLQLRPCIAHASVAFMTSQGRQPSQCSGWSGSARAA